jgi:hypothetical protein
VSSRLIVVARKMSYWQDVSSAVEPSREGFESTLAKMMGFSIACSCSGSATRGNLKREVIFDLLSYTWVWQKVSGTAF